MKIYRVSYKDDFDEHTGYSYHSLRRDAKAAMTDTERKTDVEIIEVKATKSGIVQALNEFGGHPNNG